MIWVNKLSQGLKKKEKKDEKTFSVVNGRSGRIFFGIYCL
jgi:hypothetical protein